ncbi:MAG TPA: IS66 family transposase [Bradyrhizobium sp.]|nr:IS66 family transposase [Bradyrhizobium sp.]
MILAQRELLTLAKSEVTVGRLEIERLKLMLAKARREQFGQSSERGRLLVEQLELAIEDLEETQAEQETKAEIAAPEAAKQKRAQNPRPARRPLPDNLPVERVVEPAPCACGKCGSERLHKLGEVVSKTLECEPRRWKIIERVREKFSCRDCEAITEAPAPFHPIPRGFAGPSLLAMILADKYANHQPLNRQSEQLAREGVELSVSTMADHVGACAAALLPLAELIKAHVFAAERIHGDDTTVPVPAKVKTKTGRLWTYVRDDRPFGGADPPAAVYFYSPDRGGAHPEQHLADYAGILQADAYGGFNALYEAGRKPGPITEAACWAHARRKLFELADVASKARNKNSAMISPIAFAAVQKFDAIFALERAINGLTPDQRLAVRRRDIAPPVNELIAWMKQERAKLSRHNDVAKAFDYMLKRIDAFTCFLADGRICISNNAAERALRGIALGRKAWLFAGSDRGGERAAVMLTLIQTAKLNDVDPQAWLADVLARIADHKINDLAALLPWNWRLARLDRAA